MRYPRPRGYRVRQAVVVLPSLFTLANLFFGIWSVVLAYHGDYYRASWFIVIAGVLDVLDGVFARIGHAGTRFGQELDSLVDLVSFGVAPAILMYFVYLSKMGGFAWVFSYAFVVCVALRLARYNVQATGEHKATFTGLPSPAAGMTLAVYYPFTQTALYQSQLSTLPWFQILLFLIIALSLAMVSNIRYARLPRMGFRTLQGLLGLAVNGAILGFGIWARDIFFFPLALAYLSYGLARAAVVGYLERGEEPVMELEPGPSLHEIDDTAAHPRRREPPIRGA